MGLCTAKPVQWVSCGPLQSPTYDHGKFIDLSVATWATGHVTSFHQLLAAPRCHGNQRGVLHPDRALALIAEFHRGATRSRAIGIHQSALHWGLILGGFSGYIADNAAFGWRFAFSACGIIGVGLYGSPICIAAESTYDIRRI